MVCGKAWPPARADGNHPGLCRGLPAVHFFLDLCRLFIFRFIQGCGLGGEVPVAATYVNELARAKGRGTFVLLYELVFTFGLLAAAALGLLVVPDFGWRVMFVIGAAIGFVMPWLRRSLPESPRWLAGQLRFDEAEQILAMIEDEVSEHGRVPLPPVNPNFAAPEVKKTSWAELLQGMYLRRTLTVWVIWFCGPFCTSDCLPGCPRFILRCTRCL